MNDILEIASRLLPALISKQLNLFSTLERKEALCEEALKYALELDRQWTSMKDQAAS